MRKWLIDILKETAVAGIGIAICLMAAYCLVGCKQQCIPQTIIQNRDSIVIKNHTDSIYLEIRDSIYVEKTDSGKLTERWRTAWKVKIVERIDTIHDVQTINQTIVKTEKYIPQYYHWCSRIVWILIAIILARIVWWAVKKYYLHL